MDDAPFKTLEKPFLSISSFFKTRRGFERTGDIIIRIPVIQDHLHDRSGLPN